MTELLVPISPGELIDKITILEIKSQRMTDPVKLANVPLHPGAEKAYREAGLLK